MARPIKQGLDYFPLDTILNSNMELIEAQYGIKGFAVIVKLYQMIYRDLGYYCEWDNDVQLVFAKRNGVSAGCVSEIVNTAIKRGIFDKAMYDKYNILTSAGIQQRYVDAKRNGFERICQKYLLVSIPKIEENATKTPVNATKTPVNNETIPQSKVKERKGKESKEKESGYYAPTQYPTVEEVKQFCISKGLMIDCEKFISHYNSVGWKIHNQPLIDWQARVMSWYKDDKKREQEKPKGTFNNYNQKVYSNAELEEIVKRKQKKG